MSLALWLLAEIGPLAVRVLLALGISVVTFTGVDTALSGLISMAQSSWSGIGADVLGLAAVAQVPACLGLIAGAMTARVAAWVAVAATRWVTAK